MTKGLKSCDRTEKRSIQVLQVSQPIKALYVARAVGVVKARYWVQAARALDALIAATALAPNLAGYPRNAHVFEGMTGLVLRQVTPNT